MGASPCLGAFGLWSHNSGEAGETEDHESVHQLPILQTVSGISTIPQTLVLGDYLMGQFMNPPDLQICVCSVVGEFSAKPVGVIVDHA